MPRGTATVHIRPVIDREEIGSLVDVQEMLLELQADDGPVRLLEIGRKRFPGVDSDSPNWGHVRAVADDHDGLGEILGDASYTTTTQGERHQSATRVAAQGSWQLDRAGTSTFLRLQLDGSVDDDLLAQLHVHPEASYVVNVKNPRAASDTGLDPEERPELPDDLQQQFDGNRWTAVDPPRLLDHVGVEFILVPAELRASRQD